MATQVIINPVVTFDAAGTPFDLSPYVEAVEIPIEHDEVDFTNAGSGGNKQRKAGLQDSSITLTLQQDYADNMVDELLFNALGQIKQIKVKANNAATSVSNPSYDANYLISKHQPVSGKVGDKAVLTITWPRSGGTTRSTT